MGIINYPPEELYSKPKIGKPNYDLIILWMLYNNETCKWGHFRQDPTAIPTGTLSRHLDSLKRKGLVDNFARGQYRITFEGKRLFHELSIDKKKMRKLNYPPERIIKSGRNYSDWILWMVYNNSNIKRSDFLEKPLMINQSSLSKNLSKLLEKKFISKEEGKYYISQKGKSEYSRMLRTYDLDRQTILDEEGKRIKEITDKTNNFLKKFDINDINIQYRFLSNILKMEFEKVKSILKNEENFYKILLYLSINHPDEYPNFISSEDFSKTYKIKKTTLDYYIDEISDGKIYPLRFFKLKVSQKEFYYFQSGGRVETILRAITEEKITQDTYLQYLFVKKEGYFINLDSIIKKILDYICPFLFHEDLRFSLGEFLILYIKFLAYKFEKKGQFKGIEDKLEGYIWQSVTEIFHSNVINDLYGQYEDQAKEIDRLINKNPKNLNLYYLKVRSLIYFNQYSKAINLLNNLKKKFPENEKELKIIKAMVLKRNKDLQAGLEIINDLIENYPNDHNLLCYKAYWLQYLDKKEESITLIKSLLEIEPEKVVYLDTYGEILMYFEEYEQASRVFLKAIIDGSQEWYIYQTYIKLGICYKALGESDLAKQNLEHGQALLEKITVDLKTKQNWFAITNLFLSEIK
jgi:DNA-binding HxlR family transcriptional regulator